MLLRSALIAAAYVGSGVLSIATGMITSGPNGLSTTVWLPPGIALTALLVWGKRYWPGVWVGALILDSVLASSDGATPPLVTRAAVSLLIGTSSTLQAVITCALVRRFSGKTLSLDRSGSVLAFLGVGALVSVFSAGVGSLTLVAFGIRKLQDLPFDALFWWVGDTVSVFLVVPVALAWLAEPARLWRPRRLQLTLPLCLALVMVATAFSQANRVESERAQADFEQRTKEIATALAHELDDLTDAAFVVADFAGTIDYDHFHSLVARLRERNHSVAFAAWVPHVLARERTFHEYASGRDGQPGYEIREFDADQRQVSARARADYFPIQISEPDAKTFGFAGFDLASVMSRRALLDASRRSGKLTMSQPIDLLGFSSERLGVMVAMPVYRLPSTAPDPAGLRGFVVCALRIAPLMRGILNASAMRDLDLRLQDVNAPEAQRLFYSNTDDHVPKERLPFSTHASFSTGGRTWRLDVQPTAAYVHAHRSWLAPAVSLIGLTLALLLCGFLLVTTGHRASSQQLVVHRTRELSQANVMLRAEIEIHERMERALKDAEQELTAHREQLEALVKARTAELEIAKAAAEDANRAKSLFLANMSHELRTPMHAVLAYARLGLDKSPEPKLREFLTRIAASGERLLFLLNDLLDLSKLEAGKMLADLSSVDLEKVLRDVAREIEPLLAKKQLTLDVERAANCTSCVAAVDTKRMQQLFHNVLANAARFSSEGGRIGVCFANAELPSDATLNRGQPRPALEIAISDEGIGIPENELELIFDKFVQSTKTRTNAGGTGLGLAICRQIAELHSGTIRACNRAGRGATIVVTVPLQGHAAVGVGEAA